MAVCVGFIFSAAIGASAAEEPPARSLPQIFRTGLVFYDLVIPLNPLDHQGSQDIRAGRAEVQDPPNLLRISDLRASIRKEHENPLTIRANAAVYDFTSGGIHATDGFAVNHGELSFEGIDVWKKSPSMVFDATQHFEIQLTKPTRIMAPPAPKTRAPASPFHFDSAQSSRYDQPNPMAPLTLVQNFAADLSSFIKCWRWTGEWNADPESCPKNAMAFISREGGHIDLDQTQIQLAGPSAIVSRQAVLISAGGIQITKEETSDNACIRIKGQGGIQAWVHAQGSDELWIRSTKFEGVSDRQIVQHSGGPVMIGSRGAVLVATQNWQYVRLFPGGKVILSPGDWQSYGNLAPRSK